VVLLGTNWELEEQIENIINNHWALGESHMEYIWEHQIPKNPQSPSLTPYPPNGKELGLLGASLAHVIGCEEFLFLIVLVTIWPMNCGDVLKPINEVGQTQNQKHVFAQFIRHKHKYNTKEKQRVLIGV
jgi:hypothetical protein